MGLSETIDRDGYVKVITRDYEGTGTGLVEGRNARFHIGTEYDVDYAYEATGRLKSVAGSGIDDDVKYMYLSSSDLVNYTLFYTTGQSSPQFTRQRVFESSSSRIAYVQSILPAASRHVVAIQNQTLTQSLSVFNLCSQPETGMLSILCFGLAPRLPAV